MSTDAEPSVDQDAGAGDADRPSPPTIGLSGGIGSGKSTVAGFLTGLGAYVVDTDVIARSLTLPGGAGIAPIRTAFGDESIDIDGAMDRARMRERVFADPTARHRLEAILHPLIGIETERQAAAAPPGATVVFDVPLLVESARWRERVDKVLIVDCSEETQVARVMARSGWTEAAVRAVLASQATRQARRAIADAVILNDGVSLAELEQQVRLVWQRWHPVKQSRLGGPAAPALDSAP